MILMIMTLAHPLPRDLVVSRLSLTYLRMLYLWMIVLPTAASSSCGSGDTTSRIKVYKSKLRYNPEWRLKWPWIEYNDAGEGMLCSLCKQFGNPPSQAHGAWVTRPICNWVKATELLTKHEKSDWHRASVEASTLPEMTKR